MKKLAALLFVSLLWWGMESTAQAQVAVVSYYQPTVAYYPATVYKPGCAHTTYYAPAPAVAYQPVARVRTRYRPILGGTVTRVRYGYAPVYYSPPVVVAY